MSKCRDKSRVSHRKVCIRYKLSIASASRNEKYCYLYDSVPLDKVAMLFHQIASELNSSLVTCKRKMDGVLRDLPRIHKYI